jgi:hypothetical protein
VTTSNSRSGSSISRGGAGTSTRPRSPSTAAARCRWSARTLAPTPGPRSTRRDRASWVLSGAWSDRRPSRTTTVVSVSIGRHFDDGLYGP